MADTSAIIEQVYSAFNRRDIDGVFAHMSENVSWPRASESGRALGKDQVRAYWTRQWQEFDPRVEPVAVTGRADGKTEVRVHQLVKNLSGDVLFDGEVFHVYTFAGSLIDRMDIEADPAGSASAASAAFSAH